MKQTITHYERELLDLLVLQAAAANLLLRQATTAIKHVLLVDDVQDASADFVIHDLLYASDGATIEELTGNLELTVADPLTEVCDE